MPITYTIDRDHGVVLSRAWDVLTYAELREHYFRLAADPDFDPGFCQLADNRQVHRVDMTAQTLRQLAGITIFAEGRPRALVVSAESDYGLARMYAIFSETAGQKVAVFREWADALQWLVCTAEIPAESLPR
jgi:hypothetical protein